MSAQPPISIVDRSITLAELFEPELFTELCRTWVDLYRVGVKVFDAQHHKVVDVQFGAGLVNYLFNFADARHRVTHFISELKAVDVDVGEWRARDEPLSGTRWLVAPVVYNGDLLGKLVVGPYLAAESETEHRPDEAFFSEVDLARFDRLRNELRRVADSTLRKIMESLLKSIDVVCHAGYKAVLTSNMHLESITSAYDALQAKNRELEASNLQLVESNGRLRELDTLKSNFLATVSHELRTPLTSVIGYSEMLLEGLAGPLSGEQREYVTTIMEKGESLLHLISGILDISKIEKGGTQELNRQVVRPEAVLDAITTVRPQAQKKDLTLDVVVAPDLPNIYVDTYKVRQVLLNLLSNAVKFTLQGGRVTVKIDVESAEGATPWVRYAVEDTGIGIPADKLDRVFDVFFQVDNSSTREYGGTGLGLSIVRSFVESHGGSVRVQSVPGQGSTFSFTMPTVPETPR